MSKTSISIQSHRNSAASLLLAGIGLVGFGWTQAIVNAKTGQGTTIIRSIDLSSPLKFEQGPLHHAAPMSEDPTSIFIFGSLLIMAGLLFHVLYVVQKERESQLKNGSSLEKNSPRLRVWFIERLSKQMF